MTSGPFGIPVVPDDSERRIGLSAVVLQPVTAGALSAAHLPGGIDLDGTDARRRFDGSVGNKHVCPERGGQPHDVQRRRPPWKSIGNSTAPSRIKAKIMAIRSIVSCMETPTI